MAAIQSIVYNSKTIIIPKKYLQYQVDAQHDLQQNRSANGIIETLNIRLDEMISIDWRNFRNSDSVDATFKRNMEQFYQYVCMGNTFRLAFDTTKTALTTLASSAAAGASSIALTSGSGISAGDQLVIRSATNREIVKILSAAASPTFTLVEPLNAGWNSGDRARSQYYWTGRLLKPANPVIEKEPFFFDVHLQFIEDMNS